MVTPTTKWIWINCAWQMMLSVLFLEDCYCLSWEQVCISQGSQKNWTSRLYTHIRTDLLYSMCVLSRSVMSNSSRPHVLQPARFLCPWGCPWGCSRQEYWGGLPIPIPGHLPDPGTEFGSLASPALVRRFLTTGKPPSQLCAFLFRQ